LLKIADVSLADRTRMHFEPIVMAQDLLRPVERFQLLAGHFLFPRRLGDAGVAKLVADRGTMNA
jgi:hypothetical protein